MFNGTLYYYKNIKLGIICKKSVVVEKSMTKMLFFLFHLCVCLVMI